MARKPPRARGARTSGKRAEVGYGRPPVEHQFKPGQSGNKRGRPKGAKNEATILNELLSRKININQNGKTRRISVLEGMFLKFAEDALRGNPKSAAFLLSRKQLIESIEQPAAAALDPDEQKILDAFIQEIEEKFKKQGDDK
jgi:uncharacterized protein DUF5681